MSALEDRIDLATDELEEAVSHYLRTHGWKHTSSTPDHVWRWVKDWKGQTLMTSESEALAMQRNGIWT